MIKINKFIFLLLMGLLLFIPQAQAEWIDVSPSVEITRTPQALDRVKRVLFSYVTITNASAEALVDPVRLVITNPSIPVLNATGTIETGESYLEIAGGLSAGEKTTVRVDFQLARVKLVFGTGFQEFQNLVAGRVADGYLVGVIVCIDLNANRKCDKADEPFSTTKEGGHYSINLPSDIDSNNYSFVAEVPKGAIDEDDGLPVESGYTLSSPEGKSKFISPVTSLIHSLSVTESISIQQAEDKIKLELNIEQSIDLFSDYISSNDMDASVKKKIHAVAQISAKIMAENHDPILEAAQLLELDGRDFTKNTVDAINLHIVGQLNIIDDVVTSLPEDGVITDATINSLPSIIPLPDFYQKVGLSITEIETFEPSLEKVVEAIDIGSEIDEGACTDQTALSEKRTLVGLKYCIDIEDGEEDVRFFDISYQEQETMLILKDLKHTVAFDLYKKERGVFKKITSYGTYSLKPWRVFYWEGKKEDATFVFPSAMLPEGEYKIVFTESSWRYSSAKAEIHITSDLVLIDPGTPLYKLNVNPYELEIGKTNRFVGTLQSIHDKTSYLPENSKLIDVIPLRSSNSIAKIDLSIESAEELNVAVVNAVYLSKIWEPEIVLPEDGILWSGSSNDLMDQSFLFSQQQGENAYYVIISSDSDNEAWSTIDKYIKYQLTVTPQSVSPVVFKTTNKSYQAKWANLELTELIDRIQLLKPATNDSWEPIINESEFYFSPEVYSIRPFNSGYP